MSREETIVPALGHDWLTALYDPVVRLTTRERRFKSELLAQLDPPAGARVLDLACGTGTFALLTAQRAPQARIVGLDADPKILAIARDKAATAAATIRLTQGLSFALPYRDASFDRVASSLFFHHLTTENKHRTFAEIVRVLHPGGELHVADWGRATDPVMQALSVSIRVLDGFENTRANFAGELPAMLVSAGLVGVTEGTRFRTIYGTITLLRGRKPAQGVRG